MIDPKHLDRTSFSQAVERAMREKGMDQYGLAAALGVSQPAVSDWINQKKTPSRANLRKLIEVLGLGEDVVIGNGARPTGRVARAARVRRSPEAAYEGKSSEVVLVPRDGLASAGGGSYNESGEIMYDPYPYHELLRLTQRNPSLVRSALIVGDSMEPDLRANDTVLYVPVDELSDYGLYVFEMDGRTLVKYLQPSLGGVVEIIPANERYRRERLIPLHEADTPNSYRSELTGATGVFRVRGKVVFYPKPA